MTMKKREKGFTLVEALVAAAISTLILMSLWSLVSMSCIAGSKADMRLKTGQAFLLLNERLNKDFSRLHISPGHGVEMSNSGITLWTSRGIDEDSWKIEIQKISYKFNKTTKRVSRMIGTGEWKSLPGRFEKVDFRARGNLERGLVLQFSADGFIATLPLTALIARQKNCDWICRVEPVS